MNHHRIHRLFFSLVFAAVIGLAVNPVSASVCPADVTGDNVVDTPDHDFLLGCWGAISPGSFCAVVDFDDNGVIDAFDSATTLSNWGPCPSPACPADLNEDDQVGTADQDMLLACWGKVNAGSVCAGADFDDSGDVGSSDLASLLGNWGTCP